MRALSVSYFTWPSGIAAMERKPNRRTLLRSCRRVKKCEDGKTVTLQFARSDTSRYLPVDYRARWSLMNPGC